MSIFGRKKMNEQEFENEEIIDGEVEEIPFDDESRTDEDGENMKAEEAKTQKLEKSAREIELENRLGEETLRREAAEAKLVGVQEKFNEVKTEMERETQGMRARMQKTLEDRAKQGQYNFLLTLLPVLDNLNLAIQAGEQNTSGEHLFDGVKGTARSFEQALMSVGVEAVPSVGEDFNPEFHEAVDMVEVEPEDDGKIISEFSRGYKLGDRLLRPARVQVGKALAQKVAE